MARQYHKSKYTPKHPSKYIGNPLNIVARSSWERRFFIWCDNQSSVVSWSSEETVIPYVCPTDGKVHRYFVDARIKIVDKTGNAKEFLIEIKPFAQTLPPKGKKNLLEQWGTYGKNQAKWEAARHWAKKRGMEFKIITEYELGIKKR